MAYWPVGKDGDESRPWKKKKYRDRNFSFQCHPRRCDQFGVGKDALVLEFHHNFPCAKTKKLCLPFFLVSKRIWATNSFHKFFRTQLLQCFGSVDQKLTLSCPTLVGSYSGTPLRRKKPDVNLPTAAGCWVLGWGLLVA